MVVYISSARVATSGNSKLRMTRNPCWSFGVETEGTCFVVAGPATSQFTNVAQADLYSLLQLLSFLRTPPGTLRNLEIRVGSRYLYDILTYRALDWDLGGWVTSTSKPYEELISTYKKAYRKVRRGYHVTLSHDAIPDSMYSQLSRARSLAARDGRIVVCPAQPDIGDLFYDFTTATDLRNNPHGQRGLCLIPSDLDAI